MADGKLGNVYASSAARNRKGDAVRFGCAKRGLKAPMRKEVEEFEALFLPQLDAAYNLARWLVGRDEDAQDIVQETYHRAWKNFAQFRGDNPRGWLLTILRNAAYTWLKKRNMRDQFVPFNEETHIVAVETSSEETDIDRRREQLYAALARLPREFREVLVLYELEGLSYKEIANTLKIPLGTIMSRLSRARHRLQQDLNTERSEKVNDEL
jgi:RNA polymerase sigma-70 factor (ECF subfamily)